MDITKCSGYTCYQRDKCHRYTVIESYYQSWFSSDPRTDLYICDYFIPNCRADNYITIK